MSNIVAIKKKICLLGLFSVGKTSLVRRFVYDVFDDLYLSTLGVKVMQKHMPATEKEDGTLKQYQFMIWDIEGQEKFNDYLENYFQGSAGAVLVADLTRKDSWDVLPKLMGQFAKINPEARFVLAANKADLLGERHRHFSEIAAFAKEFRIPHFLTSAKTGLNVEQVFLELARLI